MGVSLLDEAGELLSHPVYADHNHATPPLDSPGTSSDLDRAGITLSDGVRLLLYDMDAEDERIDDVIAVGIVRFDQGRNRWVADIDSTTTGTAYVHFSDLDETSQRLWLRHRPENGEPFRS